MRTVFNALTKLVLVLILAMIQAPRIGATPITTFSSPVQFRTNNGPNSLGLPTGDYQYVGILNVSPTTGTSVTATQGAVTRTLSLSTRLFATEFYALAPFDPSLTGAWSITATNGPNAAGPVLTNAISTPVLMPFVENLQVVGSGATPTLTWTLPNLGGISADSIWLWITNDDTNNTSFTQLISGTATQFTVPNGVLAPGVPYVFGVHLQYLENRSSTFTQVPYVVPEPGTGILIGLGLGALARRRREGSGLR
jgi:hypothetical protein